MKVFLCISAIWLSSHYLIAQTGSVQNVKEALRAGSSRELVQFCNKMVEINIDGDVANYDSHQAENVLKQFFSKYPAKSFSYLHEGSSREGLKYAIGEYTHYKGTHRAYILFKRVGSNYLVDTIKLTLE